MKLIDDDFCIDKIIFLFEPILEFFDTEDWEEQLENFSKEELNKKFDKRKELLNNEKEIFQYISILSYDYPNKDLMLLIIKELYLYFINYPKYTSLVDKYRICQNFKKYITKPNS